MESPIRNTTYMYHLGSGKSCNKYSVVLSLASESVGMFMHFGIIY
jgi:hypothetical protein